VGGAYSMNGGGERSADRPCETIRGKVNTWKYVRSSKHSINKLIEIKNKKNFNFKSACNSNFEETI